MISKDVNLGHDLTIVVNLDHDLTITVNLDHDLTITVGQILQRRIVIWSQLDSFNKFPDTGKSR